MRWSKAFAVVLAGGFMLACDRPPTAANEVEVGTIALGRGNDNGATIWLPDANCAVIDGNGDFFLVDCRMQVGTPSSNGNATAVVQASGVPNPTGMTVHWGPWNPGRGYEAVFLEYFGIESPPYPCGVILGNGDYAFTLNWHAIVTPSGQATLTCHYSDKWEYEFPS